MSTRASANHRLDQHGITDARRLVGQELRLLPRAMIARHDRDARLLHKRLRRVLQPHRLDGGCRRADEDDPVRRAHRSERRIFRQEAITRMNAGRAGLLRHLDDRLGAQIALTGGRRSAPMRLVGEAHERCVGIGIGMNRDAAHAEPARSAKHAQRDLAAIGDKD
jgi:hypothetical protein